jgi:hypothetical protein
MLARLLKGFLVSLTTKEQRRFANSTHLAMRFRTLWAAALLDKDLKQCTDHEVGELMVIVQKRFGLLESEFAVCHHARRRLLHTSQAGEGWILG